MALDPKELHHEFVVESTELLAVAEGILLNLENSEDLEPIHGLFRAMHTIKGTSAFLGFKSLSDTSHAIESLLDGLRAKRYRVSRPVIDLMLLFIDATRAFLQLLHLAGADRALKQDFSKLRDRIRKVHSDLENGKAVLPPGASGAANAAVKPGGGSGVIPAPVSQKAPDSAPTAALAVTSTPPVGGAPAVPAGLDDDLAKLLDQAAAVDVKWALPWEKNATPTKLAPKSEATPTVVGSSKGTAAIPPKPGTGSTPAVTGTGSSATTATTDAAATGTGGIPAPSAKTGKAAKPAKPAARDAEPDTHAASASDLHTLSGPTASAAVSAADEKPTASRTTVGPALEKRDRDTRLAVGPGTGTHELHRETNVIAHTFRAPGRGGTRMAGLNRGRDGGDTMLSRATLRVDAKQIDELINLVGEMVLSRNRLVEATNLAAKRKARRGTHTARRAANDRAQAALDGVSHELVETLDKATTAVHKAVMRLRMINLEPFFQRFPRLVHDLSGQLNKMIRLEIAGEDTELDKSVVEAISEPLVHLVRNAAYHGIETPDERVKAGKPRAGSIFLSARPEGESVAIMIEDDGRGLDIKRIGDKALRMGLLTAEQLQRMPPQEIIELVFLPGFSTEDQVGAISGRGVGLDVVRDYISQIGGSVSLTTEPGSGTRITLNLPMTLAILRALLVEVNGMTFAVPLSAVRKTRRLRKGDVRRIHGQWIMTDLIVAADTADKPPSLAPLSPASGLLSPSHLHLASLGIGGHHSAPQPSDAPAVNPTIPLTWADQGMGFVRPGQPERPLTDAGYAVLIGVGGKTVAWAVDRLLGQEDIVAKSLPQVLGPVPGLAGATIASDGATILIADVSGFTTQVES